MRFDMIVETPQRSRNKYEMDPAKQRIRLDRLLFTSTAYPYDYGFVPGTLAEDDDPLDALVLGESPTFPGCVINVRPVGVFWMHDERGPDAKVLCVPANDPRFANIQDIQDVQAYVLNEIGHFFDVYKDLEPGKSTNVRGWESRAEAEAVVSQAVSRLSGAPSGAV
ncbi:inorganic diphosphatase [Streptosporangium sp. 'caverna']|uniref:inorganic diphosphatase n=1 Tax=Streptosporangium sp. 'caverna' TaxID=2202249 RepID=UPI000D7EACA3|nr:inorganic diphosphatase [Streptosporangium sp. 'caverna']AWS44343.1 inorganic pyrophosphatase [Streptosporangium sp. 'caverna']